MAATWRSHIMLITVLLEVAAFLITPSLTQQQRLRRPRDRVVAAIDIPVTSFSCEDRVPGYYADVETGCQVYHMCTEGGRQFSYRCPNTTLFQQRMLICAHWYQVNCSRSEQHYDANLLIGQKDRRFVEESEQVNIYFNGKDVKDLANPNELQQLQHVPTVQHNHRISAENNQNQGNHRIFSSTTLTPAVTTSRPRVFSDRSKSSIQTDFTTHSFQQIQSRTTNFVPFSSAAQVTTPSSFKSENTTRAPSDLGTNETNYNFLARFNPEEALGIESGPASAYTGTPSSETPEYTFLDRFVPENDSLYFPEGANHQLDVASFVNRNLFSNVRISVDNLEPPVQAINVDLTVPFDEIQEMESNALELKFQDPRQAFYIPDNEHQVPAESATPITISIPRENLDQFRPMLFLNSGSEVCYRCHPSFIVNKKNCTPCVIIR